MIALYPGDDPRDCHNSRCVARTIFHVVIAGLDAAWDD
jgi:hypothetical protein